MKVTIQQPLWEKIQNFRIDDPNARTKFFNKLASQNNWTPTYAQRVIEEYRRFMFLCSISPKGASPSYDIDQAWHLHLTYTQNYWKDFCRDTLGKEIHHHPSKGGTDEDHKHIDWYAETLQLYEEVFEERPPGDIWPPPGKTGLVQSALPSKIPSSLVWTLVGLSLVAFVYPIWEGTITPFGLGGEDFLLFYLILGVCSLIGIWFIYRYNKKMIEQMMTGGLNPKPNAFQLTYYLYTRGHAIQTAIFDLVQRDILEPVEGDKFIFKRNGYVYSENEVNPLMKDLSAQYKEGDISYRDLSLCYDRNIAYEAGLDKLIQTTRKTPGWIYSIGIFALLIAIARIIQGIQNHRPVGYLGIMVIVMVIFYISAYIKVQYKRILRQLVSGDYPQPILSELPVVPESVNRFALLGLAALPGGVLLATFNNNLQAPGHGYNPSGCGSGSSCGSSGGDGGGSSCGGGGGCGGCGGGD